MVRLRASTGWSHSNVTPTTSSPAPRSNRISVVDGRSETMRMPRSYDRRHDRRANGVDRARDARAGRASYDAEAASLRERLEAAARHADGTTARVQEARDRLTAESGEVEQLESMSWSRILSALRGGHATDLEREQAERDAARYAVADAQARDELAWRDVEAAQAQLDALGDVDQAYADALTAKEQWAATHDPLLAQGLAEVTERRGVLLAEDQEGREAYDVGVSAGPTCCGLVGCSPAPSRGRRGTPSAAAVSSPT